MARAKSLSPDQRRIQLIDATRPLLYVHGRAVTTKQVAQAAGVAEGTIFRVFASKDELIDAAIDKAFDPGPMVDRIVEIKSNLHAAALEDVVVALVSILQQRFLANVGLMRALGMVAPPERLRTDERRKALDAITIAASDALRPYREQLRIPVTEFVVLLRSVTFAASHRDLVDGHVVPPDQITDLLLHGARNKEHA